MINDYGILKWGVGQPFTFVNYQDLTVSIENGALVTRTHQKLTSLYQYITFPCQKEGHKLYQKEKIEKTSFQKQIRCLSGDSRRVKRHKRFEQQT